MTTLEVQRHNQTVLDNLEPGDRCQFDRGLYDHWAVYVGNNEVVHLAGVNGHMGSDLDQSFTISGVEFDKGIIRKDSFWDVVGDSKAYKNNSKDSKLKHFEASKIVQRALSKVGEVGYNILFKNCEHFATWCRYDKEESDQADGLLTALAVGGAAAVVGLAVWLGSDGKKEKEKESEY